VAHFIPNSTLLPYLVEFENQPGAQGAAVQVTITNQLGPEVDWQTFALTELGFAGVKLPVPDGLSHFETRVPFAGWTWNSSNGWHRGQTPLMVDVKAGLDIQTGLITLTLTCSDTNTGAFPEDAFAGFLPPNKPELAYYETNASGCCGPVDTNVLIQPGQGYVSYAVRPRTNQPSGTVITNAARIVFDWNDPIDTPLVFNTLDAALPVSTVLPLPAESGRTFLVRWAGQDDPGGSGVASYDVYVSTDGLSYTRWLEGTNATGAYFVGQLGHTYSFYSVARDWVGHEEAKPLGAQTWTTVSTNSPVLAGVCGQSVSPYSRLVVTNEVTGGSGTGFLYMVGPDAPAGAALNSTNGLFTWTPGCPQASRTYQITVWVVDTGNTNLMDAMTFTVVVDECVKPGLGQIVMQVCETNRLPVTLITTVPLTNVAMTLEMPAGHLENLTLEALLPEICRVTIEPGLLLTSSLSPSGGEGGAPAPGEGVKQPYLLSFATCTNQSLIGTQQLAWLHFNTVCTQQSAFVNLQIPHTVGTQPDGTLARNFAPQFGRVVVVGNEPLLEAYISTNGQPALVLYAQPGTTNLLETTTSLADPVSWSPDRTVTMPTTNLFQVIEPVCTNRCTLFFRARRE